MYREYGRWFSPSLGRDMEFLWFGKFGRPVMIFPTSGGAIELMRAVICA
jgi:esterase/lipase superfamily enzyme